MSQQHKIKAVIGLPGFGVGGIEHHVLKQLALFNREVFQIHLVTLFNNRFKLEQSPNLYGDVPEWITVHKLDFKNGFHLSEWRALCRLLSKIDPDVVMTSMFSANAVFRMLRPFFKYQCIVREHNTYYDRKMYHKTIDYFLSFLTYRVVAVSQGVKKFILQSTKINPEKIKVIYNSVDIHEIEVFKETNEKRRDALKSDLGFNVSDAIVLHVGRLKEQKNQKLLVDAFMLFSAQKPSYRLAIVGDGSENKNLREYVSTLGAADRIVFFGQRDDVYNFYLVSDFFVLSSRIEGFAIVGIEAMAFGLPVISTNVAGPDEYVIDGENGYVVEAIPQAMAQKMLDIDMLLAQDKDTIQKQCLNMASRFSIQQNVRQYEELFLSAYAYSHPS